MKTAKHPLPLATIAGFLLGCAVMYSILSRATAPEKISAPAASDVLAATKQGQTPTPLRNAETRRILNEITRRGMAGVDVRFFAKNDGKTSLSQQFINFFRLSSSEAAKLSDLVQASRAELWDAQKTQAEVTPTHTGGVVIKIPALDAGPDIYDKVMNGFLSVLGRDRYQDMMLYNNHRQFENLFDEFGGEGRIFTFEKIDHDHYNFSENHLGILGVGSEFSMKAATLDDIRKYISNPRMLEFVPAPGK